MIWYAETAARARTTDGENGGRTWVAAKQGCVYVCVVGGGGKKKEVLAETGEEAD